MAVDVGSAVGYLDLDISGFLAGLRTAQNEAETTVDNMNTKVSKGFKTVGSTLTSAGKTLTKGVTVPLASAGALAIKTGIEFESAFAGVRKTIDATEEEFEGLSTGIKEMSKVMPQSASEIAAVAEAAGQLGIRTENVLGFTKTMVMLGDATNMSSDEAATALARLANITQMPQTEFDKLGSVIVALGNNLATTEREITDMGLNLAAAGSQVGMTEAQVLGFAGALSSVGIEAAAGGTAFSKVMVDMQLATELGGEELNKFASIAGMSADQFKVKFKQDAAGALTDFIKGLQNTEEKGMSAIAVLDDMGITEVRMRDALLRAAGAGDLFTDSIDLATNAWGKNVALQAEAEQRYQTTESQLSMLKNRFSLIGITLAETLIPMLMKLADSLGKVADWFTSLNPKTQESIVKWGIFAAAVGPVLLGLGKLSTGIGNVIPMIGKMSTGFTKLGEGFALSKAGFPAMGAQASKLGAALGGITAPILAIVAAITVLVAAFVTLWKTNEDFRNKITAIWNQIKETVNGFLQGIVDRVNALGFDFKNIADLLWSIWKGFCDLLAPVFEGVFQQIANIIDVVFDVILGILDIFIGIFTGNWEQVWEGIKGIFKGVWDFLVATFQNIANVFTGILDTVCGRFGTTWENTWNAIKQFFVDIWNGIVSFFTNTINSIETAISNFIQAITNFFAQLPTNIANFVTQAWNSIVQWSVNMVNKARETGQNFLNNVVEFFTNLPYKVGYFIGSALANIVIWVTNMVNKAKEMGTNFLNQVVVFFQQLPGKVLQFITSTFQNVQKWATDMWNKAKETGTNFLNAIVSFFQQLPGKVLQFITSALDNVKTWATNMATQAREMGTNFINNVVSFLTQLPGKVKGFLDSAIGNAKTWVSQMGQKGREAIESLISNIVDAAKTIPSKMAEIGKSIVEGVWNGIKNATSWFKNQVYGFFEGIVDGVKDTLGIESPSKVFANEVGKWLPAGVASGFERAMPMAMRDIQTALNNGVDSIEADDISITAKANVETFSNKLKNIYEDVATWFETIESRIGGSIERMTESLANFIYIGRTLVNPDGTIGYVGYNGFNPFTQNNPTSNNPQPVDGGEGDTFIFNSPKPIDEIEAARQMKKTKRDLSEGF